MQNNSFTVIKDKFPTLKATVDYTTPAGCREALKFCDDFLSTGGAVENAGRITETLRNKFNLKPSGVIIDSKFTQDEFYMTKDQRQQYRDLGRSPMTPGMSPLEGRYRTASVSVEAMTAIESTVRKVKMSEQETYSSEEVELMLLEAMSGKDPEKTIVPYYELNDLELDMDRRLHNAFVESSGPLQKTAKQVRFPSLYQSVTAVVEHLKMGMITDKTNAIQSLTNLKYQGSPQIYEIEAFEAIDSIISSNVTINHLILRQLMDSFQERSPHTARELAAVINSKEEIGLDEIHETVRSICSNLRTAAKPKAGVNSLDVSCTNCGKTGHLAKDCRAPGGGATKPSAQKNGKNDNKNGKNGQNGQRNGTDDKSKKKKKCNWCGILGHIEKDCRKKKNGEPKAKGSGSPDTKSSTTSLEQLKTLLVEVVGKPTANVNHITVGQEIASAPPPIKDIPSFDMIREEPYGLADAALCWQRALNEAYDMLGDLDEDDDMDNTSIDYEDSVGTDSIDYNDSVGLGSIDSDDSVGGTTIDYDDFEGMDSRYGDRTIDGTLLSDIDDLTESHFHVTGSYKYELGELPAATPYEIPTDEWGPDEMAPWPDDITPGWDPQQELLSNFIRKHDINFTDERLQHAQFQEAIATEFPKMEQKWESGSVGGEVFNADITIDNPDQERPQQEPGLVLMLAAAQAESSHSGQTVDHSVDHSGDQSALESSPPPASLGNSIPTELSTPSTPHQVGVQSTPEIENFLNLETPAATIPSATAANSGAPKTNTPTAPGTPVDAWGPSPHQIFMAGVGEQSEAINVLSCFDGMGSAAILLRKCNIAVNRYIAVEIDDEVKRICQTANPKTVDFPGVDHSWCSDVWKITESHIAKLDNLTLLVGSPECKDMSKLRLLPDGPGYKTKRTPGQDPRPGLSGPSGRTFRQMLSIVKWATKHHPSVKYFIECVEFSDMPKDWAEVCEVLGTPYIVNAEDHSYTARNRAYWTNFSLPPNFKQHSGPKNPDECCDPGRAIIRYKACGRLRVHPIGHSWKGDPDTPEANTRKPVTVRDEMYDTPQQLRPAEAERLMGMPEGCTAGPGITNIMRLKAIGNAWDLNVTGLFFPHCLRSEYTLIPGAGPQLALTVEQREKADVLHSLYRHMGEEKFMEMLDSQYNEEGIAEAVALMALYKPELGGACGGHDSDHTAALVNICSVLDSGSAMHIHSDVTVTDHQRKAPLKGYDGSEQWTDGCGYLPIEVMDADSDDVLKIDIQDAHQCKAVITPILSMGRLIRAGWTFHLELGQLYATTPGGENTLTVELGDDNILRLPHTTRTGADAKPLPTNLVMAVMKRTVDGATSDYLHDLFNHAPMSRIFKTLEHTLGLKPNKSLCDPICWACMQAQARRRGLRQKPVNLSLPGEPEHTVEPYLGDDSGSDSSDDDDYGDDYDGEAIEEFEYEAPVAGTVKTGSVPRFDIEKLRPLEVIMVDNKKYPVIQRGNVKEVFLAVCVKTRLYLKIDLKSKKANRSAMMWIIAKFGVHKLPYSCTVYSDGCGSMIPVSKVVVQTGLNHVFIPPYEQSLNEAEQVCDKGFAVARTLLTRANAPDSLMWAALDMALYTHNRMSTTKLRGYKTPYEMVYGSKPSITHMRPFWTRAFAHVPKDKRRYMQQKGMSRSRAEIGRLIGYQDVQGTTARIMLEDGRVVHTRNVTYDITDRESKVTSLTEPPTHEEANTDTGNTFTWVRKEQSATEMHQNPLAVGVKEFPSKEPLDKELSGGSIPDLDTDFPETAGLSLKNKNKNTVPNLETGKYPKIETPSTKMAQLGGFGDAHIFIPESDQPHGPRGTPPGHFSQSDTAWKLAGEDFADFPLDARATRSGRNFGPSNVTMVNAPDPRMIFVTSVDLLLDTPKIAPLEFDESLEALCLGLQLNSRSLASDPQALLEVSYILAVEAKRDMNWNEVLAGPDRSKALEAKKLELDMMNDTILVNLKPGHPEYQRAVKEAINSRLLLDIKRNGRWKARLVKQGFRECKSVDGPGFEYHASVASLNTVRVALFSADWDNHVLYIIDVTTAFLQSDKYSDDIVKYLKYRDPETKMVQYARQLGPIYGESSAPKRWELTLAPWIISLGFIRGENEPCVFYNPDRNMLIITYVDDLAIKATESDAEWFMGLLRARFTCKDPEKLTVDQPLDYLGMEISMDANRMFLKMESYILGCLHDLGLSDCKPVSTPITSSIDLESKPLPQGSPGRRAFMTMVGMLGWLANTGRPDVAYCHSRIAQHLAAPTQSAYDAVIRVFRYLKGTAGLALSAPLKSDPTSCQWEFYSDSDFAGNDEAQNRRRSQNGYLAMLNGAPVMWASKVSSVAFAHPLIGEAHADISSGAAEVYCAANATMDILHLSYVVDEMGMTLPLPIRLQIDNAAAQAFAGSTVKRTKMKHIDCRQHWVRTLRDKDICHPVHVDTKENLADFFTKPLDKSTFWYLMAKIMLITTQAAEEANTSK